MDLINFFLTHNLIPTFLIRFRVRQLCRQRLRSEKKRHLSNSLYKQSLLKKLASSDVALSTIEANQQHYAVTSDFFKCVLGPKLKYSCCDWENGIKTLADAEDKMLNLVIERTGIHDGMSILELGCGWGSHCLTLAKKFPKATIIAMSNSQSQKDFLDNEIVTHKLNNVTIITNDINVFSTELKFDRIISIEMFEHVRNYELLMQRIHSWLKPEGLLFVHHFCHHKYLYEFDTEEKNSWMAKNFFTNGLMPADDTLDHFSQLFHKLNEWNINGKNYSATAEAWLDQLQNQQKNIIELFLRSSDLNQARLNYQFWKIFFIACSELFKFNDGNEWYVKHIVFKRK